MRFQEGGRGVDGCERAVGEVGGIVAGGGLVRGRREGGLEVREEGLCGLR